MSLKLVVLEQIDDIIKVTPRSEVYYQVKDDPDTLIASFIEIHSEFITRLEEPFRIAFLIEDPQALYGYGTFVYDESGIWMTGTTLYLPQTVEKWLKYFPNYTIYVPEYREPSPVIGSGVGSENPLISRLESFGAIPSVYPLYEGIKRPMLLSPEIRDFLIAKLPDVTKKCPLFSFGVSSYQTLYRLLLYYFYRQGDVLPDKTIVLTDPFFESYINAEEIGPEEFLQFVSLWEEYPKIIQVPDLKSPVTNFRSNDEGNIVLEMFFSEFKREDVVY